MSRFYYVAGPMRGYAEFNFPAFDRATASLRAAGHSVFSPAERDRTVGLSTIGMRGDPCELDNQGFDVREALAADMAFISQEATHIFMLPGWHASLGATAERALALAVGVVVEGAPS